MLHNAREGHTSFVKLLLQAVLGTIAIILGVTKGVDDW